MSICSHFILLGISSAAFINIHTDIKDSIVCRNSLQNNCKIFHSVLDPNAGTMAVLMDASMRFRQFCQTSRLSLPMKIAPIPLGILVKEKSDGNNEIND